VLLKNKEPLSYSHRRLDKYLASSSTLSAVGNASSSVTRSLRCFEDVLSLDDDDLRLVCPPPVPGSDALPLRRLWRRDVVVATGCCPASVPDTRIKHQYVPPTAPSDLLLI